MIRFNQWVFIFFLLVVALAPLRAETCVPVADIDGNGEVQRRSDGRLLLSHLFGFSSERVFAAWRAADATRTPGQIQAYLERHHRLWDIDANGRSAALSDGVLLLRYLAGKDGAALTLRLLGRGAGRADAAALLAYLELLTSTGDRDGDGVADGAELCAGTDPDNADSFPQQSEQTLRFLARDALAPYLESALASARADDGFADGMPMPEGGDPAGATKGNHSTVNTQERGVDEADLLRSDGHYLYAIRRASRDYAEPAEANVVPTAAAVKGNGDIVRIMQLGEPADKLIDLGAYAPAGEGGSVYLSGLYLAAEGDELIMLGGRRDEPYYGWYRPAYWQEQETAIYFADVSEPREPRAQPAIYLEGGLIDSRLVDNYLYLVTRYYPPYRPESSSAQIDEVLPRIRYGHQAEPVPIPVTGCYAEASDQARSAGMIGVFAIDLNDPDHSLEATCFFGEARTLYSSTDALYLAASDFRHGPLVDAPALIAPYNERTLIHKFTFAAGEMAYRGSGTVPGHLADNPREAAFRLSEAGQDLRVVTEIAQPLRFFEPMPVSVVAGGDTDPPQTSATDRVSPTPNGASPVILSILRDQGENRDLELIASLPNQQRPQAIGLQGERLYASRFLGDTAYLVTFRTVDPLYVIDLSDPYDPYIAGELKIEGFSDYLHPVGENLLIGVGKDAYPAANGGDSRGAWYQGLQVVLFDVQDPRQPTALQREIIGQRGTDAEILRNHLAFAGMSVSDGYRFAFGVSVHEDPGHVLDPERPGQQADFAHHGLYRFELVRGANGPVLQVLAPLITTENNDDWQAARSFEDRALLIDNAVHFYHNGRFWSREWRSDVTDPSNL